MGSGGQTSTTKASVPKELSGLYSQTGRNVQDLQNKAPVDKFIGSYTPSGYSRSAEGGYTPTFGEGVTPGGAPLRYRDIMRARGEGLESSPSIKAARQSFEAGAVPRLKNEYALSGLGYSTALPRAIAGAEAQYMLPVIQSELDREQTGINAEYNDFTRQQGLSEQGLFGPLNQIPSTFGQVTKASGGK